MFLLGIIMYKVLSALGYSVLLVECDGVLVIMYGVVIVVVAFSSGRSTF